MSTQEQETAAPETHFFQAEIKQLLDIVVHSLYTDREIFVRELISNASDALEKVRHELLTNPDLPGKDEPLAIRVTLDKENKTFTIADTGIGMTREELSDNLGTIARSGTKAFLTRAIGAAKGEVNLIGQFGVGFYSAFMVARKVIVETRSYHADSQGWRWESDGAGSYSVAPQDGLSRGTRVTLELKDDAHDFAEDYSVKSIIRKFSNFVNFPIELGGERVNTIQAIWTRNKSEITDEEYNGFYKFIANAHDEPRYRLHFTADAPLAIRALLFVPKDNFENLGFGRMDPGVDLFCRKVLIQKHPENLLPEWMRFVRGLIDSDDLPLNISRETMQDSALIRKLSKVITGRFVKFLTEESTRDAAAYEDFYRTFGRFIKEGVTSDFAHREDLAKLLRFETSKTEPGVMTSLTDYISRMKEGQKDIYYISGPSREAIEAGPYVEALRERDYEVIYNLDQIDDFVLDQLREFSGKELKSADRGDLDIPELDKKEGRELTEAEAAELCGWIKSHLADRIGSVRVSKRLVNNPAIVVTDGAMTATMQRMMAALNKEHEVTGKTLTLEVNPRHPFILRLNELRASNDEFSRQLCDQMLDNGMLAAGLLTDPRAMVERLNAILTKAAGA